MNGIIGVFRCLNDIITGSLCSREIITVPLFTKFIVLSGSDRYIKRRKTSSEIVLSFIYSPKFSITVKFLSSTDFLSRIRMSKRLSAMDDKLISEMVLSNISSASQINADMSNLLDEQQMQILSAYEQTYNYQPYLSFFLALGALSHFSQNSYYTHFASPDRRPVQLYLWLLGSSGMFMFHIAAMLH